MKLSDMLFANAMMGEGGGGGGGGDFSTATVTITNNRSLSVSVFMPYVNESYNDAETVVLVEPNDVLTATVILYKGSAYAQEGYPASGLPSSVSGDVSKEAESVYVITGNGTITFTD